ncbi:hypothetical protein [Haloferula sp.]|uniref:hypothetical protein n=1 Tax=Haloferula sp. TaxID=2497595 RepID=UPI003C75522B
MKPTLKPPLFVMVFFSIFGFIGIALLVFLWGSGDGFHDPPLVFKVFGSFIALGFMAVGFGAPISAMKKGKEVDGGRTPPNPEASGGYACPNCGANVKNAEVSPSGDVKCPYCIGWWNIHRG